MTELIDWLRATIEERLAKAKAECEPIVVPGQPPVEWDQWTVGREDGDGGFPIEPGIVGPGYEGGGVWGRKTAEYIVDNQPVYVIARCEAELAILDMFERERTEWPGNASWDHESAHGVARVGALEDAVRLLAYGYRHREGWKEGWKP